MESMNGCQLRVEALRQQARAQLDALAALKEILAQEAQHLHRHDQARRLDGLGEKVAQEVRYIQRMETAASSGFEWTMLISGLMKFTLGSLVAVAGRSHEHLLSIGTRVAQSDFERTAPFEVVVIAVGPGGVPDDVDVVALSRHARELGRAEFQIVAALESRGYCVMTPESFSIALDELRGKVLNGILVLPVAASSLERHHEGLPRTLRGRPTGESSDQSLEQAAHLSSLPSGLSHIGGTGPCSGERKLRSVHGDHPASESTVKAFLPGL